MQEATWPQVLGWRVRRLWLDGRRSRGTVAVAQRLAGVHAQLASSAELAIALRDADSSPSAVRDAIEGQRSLIKTWAVRGTLHLLPADEWPLWVAGLRTRVEGKYFLKPAWLRYHGVTAEDMEAVLDAVPRALEGRTLTRDELAREVAGLTGRPALEEVLKGGWGAVLKPLAFRGDLCFGPSQGRNVTFVVPREWLGTWREIDSAEALPEILRRFLDAYGPATRDEFARWSALDPKPIRQAFESLAPEMVEVDVEGRRGWLTASGAEQLAGEREIDVVRLLPAFDPYVIGALRHLEHLLPGPFENQVSRRAGWISPVLLVGGRIAGTWREEARTDRLRLQVLPFTPLPDGVRAGAEEHAEEIGRVLETRVELAWEAAP
jgi:hypothetical protein